LEKINSVNPFAPEILGPYFVELYKDYGYNKANSIFISVYEAQHLILKLIELRSLEVEMHIKRMPSSDWPIKSVCISFVR
jgi:hypothetical protein